MFKDYTNFCINTSAIWRMVGYAVLAIKIVLPVILIVLGVVNLSKCVVSGREEDLKKGISALIPKIALAIAIFFIPTITRLVFSLVKQASSSMMYAEACMACVTGPLKSTCSNAVTTAEQYRKTYNEELYNSYYEELGYDRSQIINRHGEQSHGHPQEEEEEEDDNDDNNEYEDED